MPEPMTAAEFIRHSGERCPLCRAGVFLRNMGDIDHVWLYITGYVI